MTSTHETPMSLFSHNKCGKITIKRWELDLFLNFKFYLFGGGVRTHPTHPLPAYGPDLVSYRMDTKACTELVIGWLIHRWHCSSQSMFLVTVVRSIGGRNSRFPSRCRQQRASAAAAESSACEMYRQVSVIVFRLLHPFLVPPRIGGWVG